ncbi:hypothetical protein [Thiomonas sp. FB-6]|uniref:hypothetical protein n=1 Tax=Thiomonas sp. FB-6 TaxID=1158291 RepID=UPI0003A7DEC3|nr:hypothetical protein [Thiomonas sp. FB-6]
MPSPNPPAAPMVIALLLFAVLGPPLGALCVYLCVLVQALYEAVRMVAEGRVHAGSLRDVLSTAWFGAALLAYGIAGVPALLTGIVVGALRRRMVQSRSHLKAALYGGMLGCAISLGTALFRGDGTLGYSLVDNLLTNWLAAPSHGEFLRSDSSIVLFGTLARAGFFAGFFATLIYKLVLDRKFPSLAVAPAAAAPDARQ